MHCHIDNVLPMWHTDVMPPAQPADIGNNARLRQALTALVVDVFKLNGALLSSGDSLVQDLGLTSARWQVLGAIAFSPVALPVSHLARHMGLSRQAVQRSVDDMLNDNLVKLSTNPHHRRAMLVTMTQQGEAAYRAASERQEHWAAALGAGLSADTVEAAGELLREFERCLELPRPRPRP
jgi:DNA-binding MarR family transcriptional regulator